MKLSFSTNAFVRVPLAKAVETIGALGYRGIEILADQPHLDPMTVRPAELDCLGQVIAGTGLRLANLNANTAVGYYGRSFWEPLFEPSLANPEPAARQWRIAYTKRCIDLARFLGAPLVSVTSGRPVPGAPPEEGLELLRESLADVLSYAAARGILIGVEYEPGLLIENAAELANLFRLLPAAELGANLDLSHCQVLGEEPERVFDLLAGRIFHVHLADIKGRKHYHLVPGVGELNFTAFLGGLARHGYQGFVTVELYTYPQMPAEAARAAHAYLARLPFWEDNPTL